MEEILRLRVSGFHQYILSAPAHLCYVSENLCQMLGYQEDELLSRDTDLYARLVHPADREKYDAFLAELCRQEQSRTVRYRILKKDGTALCVSDTAVSKCLEDGRMIADSILSDITVLRNEQQNLRFLNETMPCGVLRYSCEKTPKVTYINEKMLDILRFPKDTSLRRDGLEFYSQNIFLMIPPDERRRFDIYLKNVCQNGGPLAGEITALRYDGTRVHLFGWVAKCINDEGAEEFQSACMDMTQRHQQKAEQEQARYVKALTKIYDKIFAYDLAAGTVKCLYANASPLFQCVENITMQMEEATEKWITGTVAEEDQVRMCAFFSAFCQPNAPEPEAPPLIRYKAVSSDGVIRCYSGIFLKIDGTASLFCCRREPDSEESSNLRNENRLLKGLNENMQKLVMHFTDGLAAFEIIGDTVTPLYTSDNVCQFFGFTRDEWMATMQKRTSIREFVSRCKVAYSDFARLLASGEGEFTYFDLTQNRERQIKAVCSQRIAEQGSRRYVMLYNVDEKPRNASEKSQIYIRTFGYFDVFVNEKPIAFRNEKSKELFALLVDRRGGFVSSEEAIAYLWENEPANSVTLARYRKVALRLKNILEEYGISDIVESVNGKRRLVAEKVQCDLYDYLSGQPEYAPLFKGNYLTNYSWAEPTLAELTGEHFYRI